MYRYRILTLGLIVATGGPTLASAQTPAAAPAPVAAVAPCPSAADARRIAEVYAKTPAPMPFTAAPALQLPEVVVAAGIPASMSAGVDGTHFRQIWDSLAGWDGALVMIMKGGNVFEISTKVSSGTPSTRSKFFNLGKEGALSGHLRPDLITAIQAVQMPGNEGFVRGVFFYDAKGDSVFGVFLPGEGREPAEAQLAQFQKTWQLLQSLPQRCAGSVAP